MFEEFILFLTEIGAGIVIVLSILLYYWTIKKQREKQFKKLIQEKTQPETTPPQA